MIKKKFNCKMEDLPVIAGFVVTSFENDKADFITYSSLFADPFISNFKAQRINCMTIVKASDVLKYQKAVKGQIEEELDYLRKSLNLVEGYLKMSKNILDINSKDFGIKGIRTAIGNNNLEKINSEGRSLIMHLKRNATALKEIGLTDIAIDNLEKQIDNLDKLNNAHNEKKNERSRTSDSATSVFNDLWDQMGLILDGARAMYKGSDEVKLREYMISNLVKHVHNSKPNSDDKKEDSEPASATAE